MTTFSLETCTLRPWRVEDAASLVRHADDVRVAAHLRDEFPSPYTSADAEAWIARASAQDPVFDFAIEVDGAAVGGIGLVLGEDEHGYNGEIGYWLGYDYWGRGIATEAVLAVTFYGMQQFDMQHLFGLVFADNPASERVLEKSGYMLQGKLPEGYPHRGEVVTALVYEFNPFVSNPYGEAELAGTAFEGAELNDETNEDAPPR